MLQGTIHKLPITPIVSLHRATGKKEKRTALYHLEATTYAALSRWRSHAEPAPLLMVAFDAVITEVNDIAPSAAEERARNIWRSPQAAALVAIRKMLYLVVKKITWTEWVIDFKTNILIILRETCMYMYPVLVSVMGATADGYSQCFETPLLLSKTRVRSHRATTCCCYYEYQITTILVFFVKCYISHGF